MGGGGGVPHPTGGGGGGWVDDLGVNISKVREGGREGGNPREAG